MHDGTIVVWYRKVGNALGDLKVVPGVTVHISNCVNAANGVKLRSCFYNFSLLRLDVCNLLAVLFSFQYDIPAKAHFYNSWWNQISEWRLIFAFRCVTSYPWRLSPWWLWCNYLCPSCIVRDEVRWRGPVREPPQFRIHDPMTDWSPNIAGPPTPNNPLAKPPGGGRGGRGVDKVYSNKQFSSIASFPRHGQEVSKLSRHLYFKVNELITRSANLMKFSI